MKINVEVDLEALGLVEDPFTGEVMPGPSMRSEVVRQIIDRAMPELALANDVREEVRRLASEQARDLVAAALAEPLQKTDFYGNPKGEAITIKGLVMEEITKWMRPGDRFNSSQQGNMGELLEKLVADTVTREMKPTVDEAKKAVHREVLRLAVEGAAKALASARVL